MARIKHIKFIFGGLLLLAVSALAVNSVGAAHTDSLFVFDFRNATSTVPNLAAANTTTSMQLAGDWSSSTEGVNFLGDTVSLQSGGAATPPTTPTISIPATKSVGMAVVFSRENICANDSMNLSQIGAFAAGASQLKLQFSKCTNGNIYPECRFAGAITPTGTGPVEGTTALQANRLYRMECVKSPDNTTTGLAAVTMRVTDVEANTTDTYNFDIPATGTINNSKAVTAGHKYPLPTQANNTDQFNGMIQMLGYCSSVDAATTQTCLGSEVVAHLPSTGEEYSLYTYDLASAGNTVANQAAANTGVSLNLSGSWTSNDRGVNFSGDLTANQSTGYAKPATGNTLNIAADQAFGAAAIFSRTNVCNPEVQLLTQTGLYLAGTAQLKLQMSKCNSTSGNQTFPECRIAGLSTPNNTLALRGSAALDASKDYKLECVKAPDNGANAVVTMKLTDLATDQVTTNTFTIPATGAITTTSYLSVGNKYPLGPNANNTSQLNGLLSKVGYCSSAEVATTQLCLDTTVEYVAPPTPTDVVDEIKYAYGNTRDEVVFSWHGSESTIYYGTTSSYGSQATASASAITPVDMAGPFMEAHLTGLSLGTTYHYKIGVDGLDHTFKTAAADTDNFQAIAIGDTIASTCRAYEQAMFDQVKGISPDFVLHHGDIAIANECGTSAVHQFFMDAQSSFATSSAFMVTWGNHEYGNPTANAPVGTPRDSLANYKGRLAVPNPQTVPNDTATKITNPGCGEEISSTVNTCMGEDWGWFRSGRVLFISFPEPWYNAIADWKTKAAALMASAQADSTIDFVVAYGHRPVISSTGYTPPAGWETAFSELAAAYSPSTANPDGKFVLDLTGHRHNMEVFDNWNNLTQVVNGGGGQGLINFQTILPGSVFQAKHLGFSKLAYDAIAHTLTFSMICGPAFSGEAMTCTPGQTLYSQVFTRP